MTRSSSAGERGKRGEHDFQAMEFGEAALRQRIRDASGLTEAARMGRRFPGLREDWETVTMLVGRASVDGSLQRRSAASSR